MSNDDNNALSEEPSLAAAPPSPPEPSVSGASRPVGWFKRILDWILMPQAMAKAREADTEIPPGRRAALKMARAHADVADALLDSGDNLPLLPVLSLYREALLWLLAEDGAGKRALAVAMDTAPQSFLADASQGDVRLARLRAILAMQADLGPDNSSSQEQRHFAEMTRTSVRTMLEQMDRRVACPVRKIVRKRRWRMGMAAVLLLAVLAALVFLGSLLFIPTDLALGKAWHASSALLAHYDANVLFHTNEEMNPWFEIDLGRAESVRRLHVKNRADCCFDRATPLLVEVSNDRSTWQQVARQDVPFKTWAPRFPSIKARYIRLMVPRFSTLHLDQVKVY